MRTGESRPAVVVVFRGELDVASLAMIDAQLDMAIDVELADVLVDTSRVTFIDASALGALVNAATCLVANGRTLWLTGAARCVRRIVELTELDELLQIT